MLPGVPGGAGAVIRGAKVANVLSDADLLRQMGRAVPSGRAVTSLSQAALATIRTYGIQPYGEFDRPLAPSGTAVHHLVEKRFWQQLGFTSPTEAEQRILAVLSPQTLHGPAGKGEADDNGYDPRSASVSTGRTAISAKNLGGAS